MSETIQTVAIPEDVRVFAHERGVEAELPVVLDEACRAFPGAMVGIELDPDLDPTSDGSCQLLITALGAQLSLEQALEAKDRYHFALSKHVPATHAFLFSLRLEIAS